MTATLASGAWCAAKVIADVAGAPTLGAAIGCFATAFVLFLVLDLYQAVWLAAAFNFIVAILAYSEGRRYV